MDVLNLICVSLALLQLIWLLTQISVWSPFLLLYQSLQFMTVKNRSTLYPLLELRSWREQRFSDFLHEWLYLYPGCLLTMCCRETSISLAPRNILLSSVLLFFFKSFGQQQISEWCISENLLIIILKKSLMWYKTISYNLLSVFFYTKATENYNFYTNYSIIILSLSSHTRKYLSTFKFSTRIGKSKM